MSLIDNILNVFISSAHADTLAGGAPQQPGGGFPLIIMLVIFVLFMYFGVWRPQSKRAREQRNLVSSLAKGDEVVTAGGILGRITKVTDTYIVLAISETTEMVVQKASVISALPKGTIKSI